MAKKGSGWHDEPVRHSLAMRGVKTTNKKPLYIKEPFGLPFELTEKDKFRARGELHKMFMDMRVDGLD